MGDPAGMLAAAEQALRTDPEEEWAHRLRARAFMASRRPGYAVAPAAEAVRLAPQLWQTHLTLGDALRLCGRYREAWRAVTHARELAPDEAETHSSCGDVLDDMGDGRNARRAYLRAFLPSTPRTTRPGTTSRSASSTATARSPRRPGSARRWPPTRPTRVTAAHAAYAARGVLWHLTDLAALAFGVTFLARMNEVSIASAAVGTLALGCLALRAWCSSRRAPAGIRVQMRRNLRRPTYALSVVGTVSLVLGTVWAAALPPKGYLASFIVLFSLALAIVALVRARNRLVRALFRAVRYVRYRVGRSPAR